ncbi:MAG TPA: DUF4870 domain-containing protein [Puia sp.]|nr:DUF4870 domain-containing protein [Puia sp.]
MDTREQQIRNWSMLCHFSALASLLIPFGNILGPLLVWQIKKSDLPEIDPHGKESLNFQITILIITIIFSFFLFSTIGYGALIGSPFTMFSGGIGLGLLLSLIKLTSWVLVIVAGIKANNGELFRYPSIRFIK